MLPQICLLQLGELGFPNRTYRRNKGSKSHRKLYMLKRPESKEQNKKQQIVKVMP